MVDADAAIFADEIALPDGLAGEFEAGNFAAAGGGPDVFAVGDWGRGRSVVLAEKAIALGDLALPECRAVLAVQGEEEDFVVRIDGRISGCPAFFGVSGKSVFAADDEDGVFPNDGSGGAPAWQLDSPNYVVRFRPLIDQFFGIWSGAVQLWSAPLRPIRESWCGNSDNDR